MHMVPKVGFEPTRACAHCALNAARLPVPPLRRDKIMLSQQSLNVKSLVSPHVVILW